MKNDSPLTSVKLAVARLTSSRARHGKTRESRHAPDFKEAMQQTRSGRSDAKAAAETITVRGRVGIKAEVVQALKGRPLSKEAAEVAAADSENNTLEDALPAAAPQSIDMMEADESLPQVATAIASLASDPAVAALAILAAPQPTARMALADSSAKQDEEPPVLRAPDVQVGEQENQPVAPEKAVSHTAPAAKQETAVDPLPSGKTALTSAASPAQEPKPAASSPQAAAQPADQKKIVVTVARVETAFMPSAMQPAQSGLATVFAKSAEASVPAPMANQVLPNTTVVRSIKLQLEPEHLGEVQISLHLKGEGLRVTVEVATREAHALLQRDASVLRDVLEKAGYDVAEQAVSVTLRAEVTQAQPAAASNNDASSFQRGAQDQAPQNAGERQQQSRQQARPQVSRDEPYDANQQKQTSDRLGRTGAGGIYL